MFALAILLLVAAQLSSAIQYQTCTKLWNKMGCRKDLHLNLTILIDDRQKNVIDWDNFNGYELDLSCRCRQAALSSGYKWFAVDSLGICASKLGDLASYLREFPLDPQATCAGLMMPVPVVVPGGRSCVDGKYRPFFYTIESSVPSSGAGSAPPVGSAPEEEIEEEVAAAPEKEAEEEKISSCKSVADVVLVVDVSGSVKMAGFIQTKKFIKSFLDRFDLTDGTRIGIVTFDERCRQVLRWAESSHKSRKQLKDYCDKLQYSGGSTRTDLAIGCAMDQIVDPGKRPGVPMTAVVMTDGMTWGGSSTVKGPALALKDTGCKVIAVGIGADVDTTELLTIAEEKKDNLLLVQSFSELTGGKFLNKLIARSCR